MLDGINHTQNLRGSLVFYALVHFAEAKGLERSLLACGTANRTSYLCNFKLFHLLYIIKLLLISFSVSDFSEFFPIKKAQLQRPIPLLPFLVKYYYTLSYNEKERIFSHPMLSFFRDGKYTIIFF